MSPTFIRHLTFLSDNLGEDATLILLFNPIEGFYGDKYPVVWKVEKFGATGHSQFTETYQNQLAFLKPEVNHTNNTIVAVAAFKLIDIGQVTGLTKDENGVYSFTNPTGVVQVKNNSPKNEDMALGFFRLNHDFVPTPILYFNPIGPDTSVETPFAPVLRAYITDKYQEKQITFGPVINSEPIWEADLAALHEDTAWVLKRDPETGAFKITEA